MENVKVEVKNVKVEVENVKVKVENVELEMKDFKNQVIQKLEALIKKTPDPYSCIGCSMGSFCLDGKPVGRLPLEKAMVRAKGNITTAQSCVVVYAGDTGIGYVRAENTPSDFVIWKQAGLKQHSYDSNIVYSCGANRQ